RYTPLPIRASALELWLVGLAAIWAVKQLASGNVRMRPVPGTMAWLLAALTVGATFTVGLMTGGDVSAAIAEVRSLGYLLGLAWLVPQLVERRRDLVLLLGTMGVALGAKALQGLYRYVVVLHFQIDPTETFMAHEDPVMFVPIFYLLLALHHYQAAPRLRRLLMVVMPVMTVALVLTQRRIAYVTLALCGAFFAVALSGPARRTFLRLALPVVAVLGLYVALFAGSASPLGQPIDRALTLFDDTNMSNVYRLLELENLRYTILAHP